MKFSLFSLLALSIAGHAQDWPQWGGTPGRNMYSTVKNLPDHFTKDKSTEIKIKLGTEEIDRSNIANLRWVAKLGSQSYGNVTVAHGRVFIGTNNENPRDPRHVGDRSILMCLDENTGELLWQQVVPKLASGKVNDWESLGLLSSPTIENDRVYVVSSRCEVLCLDVNGMANGNDGPFKDEAKYVVKDIILDKGKPTERPAPPIPPGPKDGDILWRYDMIDELGVFPHNASDGAPLILGDIVYVNTSNGQDWTHSNIPSPNAPSLIALNKYTGEFLAEDDAKVGPHIFHGLWSSPSSGTVNGRPYIIYGGGDGVCYAFDPTPSRRATAPTSRKCGGTTAIRRNARSSITRTLKVPARSTPPRSCGKTGSIPRSARTPNMAKASVSSPASTRQKPSPYSPAQKKIPPPPARSNVQIGHVWPASTAGPVGGFGVLVRSTSRPPPFNEVTLAVPDPANR